MTSTKPLALAAALLLACAAGAHANTVNNSYVLSNDWGGVEGEVDTRFDISNLGTDAFTGNPTSHVANDTFVDDYYFTLPESSGLKLTLNSDFSPHPDVMFTSVYLFTATGEYQYSFTDMSFTPTAISADGMSLPTGTYALEVTGTTKVTGGSYIGTLTGIPADYTGPSAPVPEPANVALMLAGLGLVGGVARRRARGAGRAA